MHISFSEYRTYCNCPYLRKLQYVDHIFDDAKTYFAFGHAMHILAEYAMRNRSELVSFREIFIRELERDGLRDQLDDKKFEQQVRQGEAIVPEILPTMREYFGDFKVLHSEEKLMESIPGEDDYCFKAYIDLCLLSTTGRYIVVDWKTSSNRWNERQIEDPMNRVQLILYRYFFAQKHNYPIDMVDAYFGVLCKTARRGTKVDIIPIEVSEQENDAVLQRLCGALQHIKSGIACKNFLYCRRCAYRHTHCKTRN